MVMSSAEISAANAGFMQQSNASMYQANMISQAGAGYNPMNHSQHQAQSLAGRAVNAVTGYGMPAASLGLGLAGLDPMSLTMRAGAAGYGAGGVLGAGAAGLGAAAGIGVPLMAAQYAGTQMMQGMSQQHHINQNLMSAFQQPNQFGGRGFTMGEMGGIGQQMRGMSMERGPGGEFATMDELGRLASNMGRMGMAQGVRDAKDFSDKFKQMMKTVKEIATTMSTSLEQAQEMMASVRGAGIFSKGGAAHMAGAIRTGQVSGNLNAEEISQMANIGSQISRSIGGRGSAGAFGGAKAITQIGEQLQTGVLSEKDIYNATGMTGAAGRQALATSQMQGDARWLSGTQGRYFLASIAGKNGKLDEDSIAEYMAGGMGTGRTQELAGQNLAKVGRANFIQNEGRLRGEVLRNFGGMAKAIAGKGWLEQRGISVDNQMNDYNMLGFQQTFGMDRDQAEVALKQIRGLSQTNMHREQAMDTDRMMRKLEMEHKNTGMEGVKRKLEDMRHGINTRLQDAGAAIYTSGAEAIEDFINKVTGSYVSVMDRDLMPAIRGALKSGSAGDRTLADRFGIGKGGTMISMGGGKKAAGDMFRGAGNVSQFAAWSERNEKGYEEAGYSLKGLDTGEKMSAHLQEVRKIASASKETDESMRQWAVMNRSKLLDSFSGGKGFGRGYDAINAFGMSLTGEQRARYEKADDAGRARMLGTAARVVGRDVNDLLGTPEDEGMGFLGGKKFSSASDYHTMISDYARKGQSRTAGDKKFNELQRQNMAMAGIGMGGGPGPTLSGHGIGEVTEGGGSDPMWKAYGIQMGGEKARRQLEAAFSTDSGTRTALRNELDAEQARLQKKMSKELTTAEWWAGKKKGFDALDPSQQATYKINQRMMLRARYAEAILQNGGKPLTDEQWASIGGKDEQGNPINKEDAQHIVKEGKAIISFKQAQGRAMLFEEAGVQGQRNVRELEAGGVLNALGKLTEAGEELGKGIGPVSERGYTLTKGGLVENTANNKSAGQMFVQKYAEAQATYAKMGAGADNEKLLAAAKSALGESESFGNKLSYDQQKALAEQLKGERGMGPLRQQILQTLAQKDRMAKAGGFGTVEGTLGLAGSKLGVGSASDFKGMKGADAINLIMEGVEGRVSKEDMLSDADRKEIEKLRGKQKTAATPEERAKLREDEGVITGKGGAAFASLRKTLEEMEDIRSGKIKGEGGKALTDTEKANMLAKKQIEMEHNEAYQAGQKKQNEAEHPELAVFKGIQDALGKLPDAMKGIATAVDGANKRGAKDGGDDSDGGGSGGN